MPNYTGSDPEKNMKISQETKIRFQAVFPIEKTRGRRAFIRFARFILQFFLWPTRAIWKAVLPVFSYKMWGEIGESDNQSQLSHWGRLQYFWNVWEDLYCHPRVVQILRQGYRIILQSNLPMSVHPIIQRGYNRQEKYGYQKDWVLQMLQKGAIYPLKDCITPGFYSRLFLVPKTRQKMAPCDRSQCPEQLYAGSNFQNGDSRDNQKLGHKRWMASFNRPERCVLPCAHTPRFSTFTMFQCRQTNVSVPRTAIRFTRIVKEAKLILQSHGIWVHQYPDDWLLRANTRHQCQLQKKEFIQTIQ